MAARPERRFGDDDELAVAAVVGEPGREGHGVERDLGEVAGRGLGGELDIDDAQAQPGVARSQGLCIAARSDLEFGSPGGWAYFNEVRPQVCIRDAERSAVGPNAERSVECWADGELRLDEPHARLARGNDGGCAR